LHFFLLLMFFGTWRVFLVLTGSCRLCTTHGFRYFGKLAILPLASSITADTLVFSHRVSGANNPLEYFDGIASALNASGNVSAATHKFSQLNALDTFRDVDGALHLHMTWYNDFYLSCLDVSCLDILTRYSGAPSGTYTIVTSKGRVLSVWCDMTTDGGGYDIMQLKY
jgi:hypothetical protein